MRLCSLASGSSGNSIYVGTSETHILIDAGISGKRIETALNGIDMTTHDISAVLVTHEHLDHVKCLGVIARRYGLPIYATEATIREIKRSGCAGEIDPSLFNVISAGERFMIGDAQIEAMSVSHDAADPVAYLIRTGDKKIVAGKAPDFHDGQEAVPVSGAMKEGGEAGGEFAAVVTDLGTYNHDILAKLRGFDVLMLEANHDERMLMSGIYPYQLKRRISSEKGHLSNEASGRLLSEVLHDHAKKIILGHLSHENNYPRLAYEAVRAEITMSACPYKGDDFKIEVARRDAPGEVTEW